MTNAKVPRRKREVAIKSVCPDLLIEFYASEEAVLEFSEFGRIYAIGKEKFKLFVDKRFDFDEVLDHIRNYG